MSIQQRASNQMGMRKNIFGEDDPDIFFNSDIKSIKLPNYFFTNFIDGKKSPLVFMLKTERRKMLKKQVDYDNEYEIKNIILKSKEKQKINAILNATYGSNLDNYSILWRLKNVVNPAVQFYFVEVSGGTYEVLFIDIYHLVLPAADKSHKEKKSNPKKIYKEHESASYCLSKIFNK